MRVTDVDFVKAAIASTSNDELASTTGMAKLSVQARANKLRKAGVPLPKYERKRTTKVVDVAGLTALINGDE